MFDLIIIGGGPGGYHLAAEAGKEKMKVALIEEDKIGGTCLNTGCIPSKAFLHIEKIKTEANHSMDIGIVGNPLKIDHSKVVDYKNEKVKFLVAGVVAKVKASSAKIFKGKGTILKSPTPGEFNVDVNGEVLVGKNVVIATGSTVFVPDFIKGAQELYKKGVVVTSTEALDLREVPKEFVVIGAGVIGVELASYYASAGSKITLIEASNKVAGQETDTEIAGQFKIALEQKGLKFIMNSKVTEVNEKEVIYSNNETGKTESIKHDKILIAIGRRPNINCGLENINVGVEKGRVLIDDKCQTNVPGVFAIGDVTGKLMLAHTASKHAEIVIDNLLGKNVSINYNNVPFVIYCTPEIAEIGITEDRAKARNIAVTVKKLSMLYSGKFVVENAKYDGLFKIIMKKDTEEIIGMSVFGNAASELIHLGSVLVGKRFSKNQIRSLIFAHPTIGEIIKDVIFS